MQPPVWAKVWATNRVRLRRKRVAGEPNHLKVSQIWVKFQVPIFSKLCVHSIIFFASHSHQHLPEALKRSAGRGRGWPAKNSLLAFPYYHDDGDYDGALSTTTCFPHILFKIPPCPAAPRAAAAGGWCGRCLQGKSWSSSPRSDFFDSMRRESQPTISKSLELLLHTPSATKQQWQQQSRTK